MPCPPLDFSPARCCATIARRRCVSRIGLRIARESGDRRGEARVRAYQGRSALLVGDFDQSELDFADALALGADTADFAERGLALCGLGFLRYYRKNAQQAHLRARQALASAGSLGQRRARQAALLLLGHAGVVLGDLGGAANSYEEARRCGGTGLVVDATASLAALAAMRGDVAQAATSVRHSCRRFSPAACPESRSRPGST